MQLSERCWGEAGALGTARPDLANPVRFRKSEEITQGVSDLTGQDTAAPGKVKLPTACHQGLAKYADETAVTTDYVVVGMA